MKKAYCFLAGLILWVVGCAPKKEQAYVPDSSGNINHVTVVMPQKSWQGALGDAVKNQIATVYEGLPLDEPRFTLRYMSPKNFTGFARHGRNILWFKKDTINQFRMVQNQFAQPQIVAFFQGEDDAVMVEYVKTNADLLVRSFTEAERQEKIRRIKKSVQKKEDFRKKFGASMLYPSAYTTVKDTVNFLWIEKPIQKGTMNIIAYRLPKRAFSTPTLSRVIQIRDSIGQQYIPGRLPKSHMITEKAYLPYFYKTKLDESPAYMTKGMWEVKRDFMAGPFVQYIVADPNKKDWLVVEGFAFAPSVAKRDYMFELNSILSTLAFEKE